MTSMIGDCVIETPGRVLDCVCFSRIDLARGQRLRWWALSSFLDKTFFSSVLWRVSHQRALLR